MKSWRVKRYEDCMKLRGIYENLMTSSYNYHMGRKSFFEDGTLSIRKEGPLVKLMYGEHICAFLNSRSRETKEDVVEAVTRVLQLQRTYGI